MNRKFLEARIGLITLSGVATYVIATDETPLPLRLAASAFVMAVAGLHVGLSYLMFKPQDPDAGKPHKNYGRDPS